MLGDAIHQIGALLLVAALVSMAARRLRLPYTVGLTLAGIVVSLFPQPSEIRLTRDLIYEVLLPPLLFEAALQMEWPRFKAELSVTSVLATVGVLISASIVALGAHFILAWGWVPSLITAVVLSATDPVAVVAFFRDLKIGGRLQMLVESESLLNDGTAAVLFATIVAAGSGASMSAPAIAGNFILTVGGGILSGLLVGGIALLFTRKTSDHLVELTFTTLAAYGSFMLAEKLHTSGVLATMTAGILVGNVGPLGTFTDQGRDAVESFWEYVGFVANSLVFLLIGIDLARQSLGPIWTACVTITLLLIAGRAASVYGCCAFFKRSRHSISTPHQHVLFWSGLRGALGLALVLALPTTFEMRDTILGVAFAAVAFSIIIQGLTIAPLLSRLGLAPADGLK